MPAGQNRLNVSLAFQNAGNAEPTCSARVRLTLVDPNGNLAAYSVPQGNGNYGNVQITDPKAGTWTAYVCSRDSADGRDDRSGAVGRDVAQYTLVRTRHSADADAGARSVEAR